MSDNSNLLRVATMLPMDPRHRQLLTDSAAEIEALTAERDALREALDAIRQYGRDTLSGPTVKSDDTREWQREAVVEMTKRATEALKGQTDG